MIRPIASLSVEVIPQAIIKRSVREVIGGRTSLVADSDDLDDFEGASFKFGDLEIAVRHYRGFPENTTTIYIDQKIRKVEAITVLVREILSEFGLTEDLLQWERAKNPNL